MGELFEEYNHFFEVRLELFDGPIDLLLHLVKQNELPIEKIALAQVASQYLACLEAARSFDLEIAGEYLVMAATLLSIKSSILLNEPVVLVPDEDGNLVDPHEALLAKLRDAEIYKEGARKLSEMSYLGIDVFAGASNFDNVDAGEVRIKDHDPLLLGRAFKKLLEHVKDDSGVVITVTFVSVVEQMMSVMGELKKRGGTADFQDLIPDRSSRASIAMSFLAILELCKRSVIKIKLGAAENEFFVVLGVQDLDDQSLASEFDQAEQLAELPAAV